MEKIDITDYMYYKLAQSLTFDDEALELLKEGDYDLHIFSNEFLNGLHSFVEYMSNNNYLEEHYKENVLDILMYIRDTLKGTEDYLIVIDQINEMIRILNKGSSNNSQEFYLLEMGSRLGFVKSGQLLKYQEYEKFKDIVIESMSNDYSVLLFHIEKIDDETFKEEFVPVFSMNVFYYYSLRALFIEKPELSISKKLRERANLILNMNIKNLKKSKIDIKIKKEIKSETKLIKEII